MAESIPTAPQAPALSRGAVFVRRLGSTIGLWGVVAAAIIVGKAPLFFLVLGVLGMVGVREIVRMDPSIPAPWTIGLTVLSAAWYVTIFTLSWQSGTGWSPAVDFAFLAAAAFGAFVPALFRPVEGKASLWPVAWTVFAFVYVPWLSGFLTRILFLPGTDADGGLAGVPYLLFLIAATKLTDSGAYAVGSLIGKHRMIPRISPGKTWEGMIGAIAGALAGGLGVFLACRGDMPLLTTGSAVGVSLVIAVVCVVGDLAESIVKRCLAVKDSGSLLPGIGGALDLVDSLLFTAPVFYLYLLYVSGAGAS